MRAACLLLALGLAACAPPGSGGPAAPGDAAPGDAAPGGGPRLDSIAYDAPADDTTAGERLVEGRYTSGFEVSNFTPCGSTASWWVRSEGASVSQELHRLVEAARPDGGRGNPTVRVRLRGTVSPPGFYGHLGAGRREIVVREVLPPTAAACD